MVLIPMKLLLQIAHRSRGKKAVAATEETDEALRHGSGKSDTGDNLQLPARREPITTERTH